MSKEEEKWNPLLKRISIFGIWTLNPLLSVYARQYYKTGRRDKLLESYLQKDYKNLYNINQEHKEDE